MATAGPKTINTSEDSDCGFPRMRRVHCRAEDLAMAAAPPSSRDGTILCGSTSPAFEDEHESEV